MFNVTTILKEKLKVTYIHHESPTSNNLRWFEKLKEREWMGTCLCFFNITSSLSILWWLPWMKTFIVFCKCVCVCECNCWSVPSPCSVWHSLLRYYTCHHCHSCKVTYSHIGQILDLLSNCLVLKLEKSTGINFTHGQIINVLPIHAIVDLILSNSMFRRYIYKLMVKVWMLARDNGLRKLLLYVQGQCFVLQVVKRNTTNHCIALE